MLTLISFIILLFGLLPINVNAVVKPATSFYVNDYANILSSENEEYIIEHSNKLYNYNGAQIVVVTIPSLDGISIEEYATTLFNDWGIGDKDKNNGLLLLLSLNERRFRVEVGAGIEGIFPDGKTGRYQDTYLIPYLKENKWDEGIKSLYDVFYNELSGIENLEEYTPEEEDPYAILVFFLIIAVFIYLMVKSPGSGYRGGYYSGGFSGGRSSGGFSGGFSGGGGHSSGGGSSRGF